MLKVLDGKNVQTYDLHFSDNRNWKAEIFFFLKQSNTKYLVVDENNQIINRNLYAPSQFC